MIDHSNKYLHKLEIPPRCLEYKVNFNLIQSLNTLSETLESLEISHNKIAVIDYISNQNNLKCLNLSHNRLISLEGIVNLPKLQILDISYNFIGIDQLLHLKSLNSLKSLNLSHNHLSGTQALSLVSDLKYLSELNTSFNEFLNWTIEKPMQYMKKLIIDNNKLKSVNLTNMPNLEYISCVENCINEFYGLASLQFLQQLYADGNDINEIPSLAHLQILSIEHNRLSSLPNFPSIIVLNCSYNCLNSIQKLPSTVMELIACHNLLTALPFGMKKLEVLDISYNKIGKIDFLTSCQNLKILNASFNEFKKAEIILQGVLKCPITEIDVTGTNFNEKDYESFVIQLPKLEKINMTVITEEERKRVVIKSEKTLENKFEGENFIKRKNNSKSGVLEKNSRKNAKSEFDCKIEEESRPESVAKAENLKKKSLCLEIPENLSLFKFIQAESISSENLKSQNKSPQNMLNSSATSIEFTLSNTESNKKPFTHSDLEHVNKPILSPSKTEVFSILPSKNNTQLFKEFSQTDKQMFEISQNETIPTEMKEMYQKIMRGLKKSVSRKINEISVQNNQKKHHHHCSKHKQRRSKSKSIQADLFLSPKSAKNEQTSIKSPDLSIQIPFSTQSSRGTLNEKENLSENRLFSPLNVLNSPKSQEINVEIKLILKYASIPPRPILKKEASTPVIMNLHPKSQEYLIIATLFMENYLKTNLVSKTFTLALHKNHGFKDIMYFYGDDQELREIFCNNQGFTIKEITLHKNLIKDFNYTLICLTNISELKKVYKDTYQVCNRNGAIPVYLVSYTSF